MAEPFVGEIRLFGGNYAPDGWAFCNGQLLNIADNGNDVLFSLIGTTYGGDGVTTFGLPNLAGRLPIHQGTIPGGGTYPIGQIGGIESVPLTANQISPHTHSAACGGAANTPSPAGALLATTAGPARYLAPGSGAKLSLNPQTIQQAGRGVPHTNLMPFLALSFIIALQGIYPSRN